MTSRGRRIWAAVAAAATAIAAGAVLSVPGTVSDASDPADGLVAFTRPTGDGHTHELMVAGGRGENLRRLTSRRAVGRPAFSPDGTRVAFASPVSDDADGRYAIYTVAMDGTGLRRLTAPRYADFDPAWSPDGRRIAFTRDTSGSAWSATCCAIATMRADGSSQRVIPNTSGGSMPAWSPDSERLTYVTSNALRVIRRDGSGLRTLHSGRVRDPAWSPDGRTIAFAREVSATRSELAVVPAGGGAISVRGSPSAHVESPVWGSDSRTIYWVRYRGRGVDGRTTAAVWRTRGTDGSDELFGSSRPLFGLARTTEVSESGFTDVVGSVHRETIERLAEEGISRGFPDGTFRPNESVTRGQMASFLARAFDLPSAGDAGFTDTEQTPHRDAINRVAAAGIAEGRRDGTFRPNETTRRGQMASFLARALELESAGDQGFRDVAGHTHERTINAVAAAGVAEGRSDGTFAPDEGTRRGQMATFIVRALDYRDEQEADEDEPPDDDNGDPETQTVTTGLHDER